MQLPSTRRFPTPSHIFILGLWVILLAGWAFAASPLPSSSEGGDGEAPIAKEEADLGDAPEDYPTLLSENGPTHVLQDGVHLGRTVDADADGQPDSKSTGDDIDPQGDDEDGVGFNTSFVPGQNARITVQATKASVLNAWMDWNRDGDWQDAGEQIAEARGLSQGKNAITVGVPSSASLGETFARFRFSSAEDLAPTGPAPDGEVEDYTIDIVDSALQLDVTEELRSLLEETPSEVTPQTLIDGLQVFLQDDEVSDYRLFGGLLQDGELHPDTLSGTFTAEPGDRIPIPIDCGEPEACSVLSDFLTPDRERPYSLYVPSAEVFESAAFPTEDPGPPLPIRMENILADASQQGSILYLAPSSSLAKAQSAGWTLPLVIAPRALNLGRGWTRWVPPPPTLVFAEYVEVNQAVQHEIFQVPDIGNARSVSSPVPIIPGKDMVVRYYLLNTGKSNLSYSVGPDLRVELLSGGNVVNSFRISPNTGQSSVTAPPDPGSGSRAPLIRKMRSDTDSTLNYVIPGNRISQQQRIRLSLQPSLLSGRVAVGMSSSRTLGAKIVPIQPPGRNSPPGSGQISSNVVDYIEDAYPIDDMKTDYLGVFNWGGQTFTSPGGLLVDLVAANYKTSRSISGTSFSTLLGVAPAGYTFTDAAGNTASGRGQCRGNTAWTNLTGSTGAQEVGHNLDLEHVSSTHNSGGYGNEPTPYRHGSIGEFDLSGSSHDTSPGMWGNVGVRPDRAGGTWNIRLIPAGNPDSPNFRDHTHEFMSYGDGFRWISDTIYDRLHSQLKNRDNKCSPFDSQITRSTRPPLASASGPSPSAPAGMRRTKSATPTDALLFLTTVENGEYQGPRLIRQPIPQSGLEEEAQQQGSYLLELRGGGGDVLASDSFKVEDLHTHTDKKMLMTAVPEDGISDDIEQIALRQDGENVVSWDASPNSPEVQLLQPNGGETWNSGTQTIHWELSDADGDQPGILIEYSPDGGESWQPLGLFRSGTVPEDNELEVDVDALDSSGAGIVRIAATDGVNTTQDRSDETFSIGGRGGDCALEWALDIQGTDEAGNSQILTLGQSPEASAGIDQACSETELASKPSGDSLDVRFTGEGLEGVDLGQGTRADLRPSDQPTPATSTKSTHEGIDPAPATWSLDLQGTYPLLAEWDAIRLDSLIETSVPVRLVDKGTGGDRIRVDMRRTGTVTIQDTAVAALEIRLDRPTTRDVPVEEGWNLLSAPLQSSNQAFGTLFGPLCQNGFSVASDGRYVEISSSDQVPAGMGLWAKCSEGRVQTGGRTPSTSVDVEKGWNVIGPIGQSVDAGAITGTPSGIVASEFFGYNPQEGYQSAPVLQVGHGYLFRASAAGSLDFTGGGAASRQSQELDVQGPRLVVTDAAGRTASLQFARRLTEKQRVRYTLPPVPPKEAFDVRFENGRTVALLNSAQSSSLHILKLQGVTSPITLRRDGPSTGATLRVVGPDGQNARLTPEQPSTTLQKMTGQVKVGVDDVPTEFVLEKASPNPVSGRTTVRYALPERAEVTITVYDVLGRRIARLVDGKRRPGRHRARLDASTLPSGTYFVRMRASDFEQTRRVTVVK